MSHIVTIKTQIRDPVALAAACKRLNIDFPTTGTAKLFTSEATGLIVRLPAWHYPVVIDPATGGIQFDNYGGQWGAQEQLDKLLQAYAVEKTRAEARRVGHSVTEQLLPNGSIKLTVSVGGAA